LVTQKISLAKLIFAQITDFSVSNGAYKKNEIPAGGANLSRIKILAKKSDF